MKLRMEIQNEARDCLIFREYSIDEDGNAPRLLTDEVQEMLDVLRDSNKPL